MTKNSKLSCNRTWKFHKIVTPPPLVYEENKSQKISFLYLWWLSQVVHLSWTPRHVLGSQVFFPQCKMRIFTYDHCCSKAAAACCCSGWKSSLATWQLCRHTSDSGTSSKTHHIVAYDSALTRWHRNRRGSSSMCSTLNCFKQVNVIQEWDLIEGPLGGDTRDYIAVYIAPVYLSPVRDLRWQGSSCLQRTSASGSGAPVTVTDSGDWWNTVML